MARFTYSLAFIALALAGIVLIQGQQPSVSVMELYGSGAPTVNCTPPQRYFQSNATSGNNVWLCTGTNTWTNVTSGGGSGIPAGAIVFVNTGACPAGYTEVAGLDGKMVFGTLNANADVGTTGGTDNITPAGTNTAPAFTGSALGTHSHGTGTYASANESTHTHGGPTISWPAGVPTHSGTAISDHASHTHTYTDVVNHVHVQNINTGTTGGSNGYGVDTSTNGSGATAISTANPTGGVATGTTAGPSATLTHTVSNQGTIAWPAGVPTNGATGAGAAHTHSFSGSSEAVTGGTPAGTNTAPVFTGTGFDNRSAFVRLIGCKKD